MTCFLIISTGEKADLVLQHKVQPPRSLLPPASPHPGSTLLQLQQSWTQPPADHRKKTAKSSSLLFRGAPKALIGLPPPYLIFLMLHHLSQSLHLNLSFSLHLHFYFISAPTASPQLLLTHPMVLKNGFSMDTGSFLFVLPPDRRSTRNISCSVRFLLRSKMDT